MQNVLVVGSEGFIGSNLAKQLSADFSVFGCDVVDSSSYLHESNYIKICVEKLSFDESFILFKPDICINCSGSANVKASFVDIKNDFDKNVNTIVQLTDSILKVKPYCKLINLSSAAVYGNPGNLPITKDAATRPISPYGVHKLLSEKLISSYHDIFNINACSLRIFSVYGEGQKKLLLWDFLNQSWSKKNTNSIKLFGTGRESRDYIHIQDVIQQIILVINNAGFFGEVYNIGNGEEIYINDLIYMLSNEAGIINKVEFTGENKIGDPVNWKADISEMISWGYQQTVSIETGVKSYVKWFRENA
jgi:UDP-glucose 4-epimerase